MVLIELCFRFRVRVKVLFGSLIILFCIMLVRLKMCMMLLDMLVMVFLLCDFVVSLIFLMWFLISLLILEGLSVVVIVKF